MGIRSLECNYNPIAKTYNPHFHLIVPDQKTAEILIDEWLKLCTINFASPAGQVKRRVFSNEKALLEVLKYGSKIFTEPDVRNKTKKGNREIHAAALHIIFSAMKGLRIFDRFGFNLTKQEKPKISAALISQYDEWTFEAKGFDWFNDSGESLSKYVPEPALIDLLENRIETDLE